MRLCVEPERVVSSPLLPARGVVSLLVTLWVVVGCGVVDVFARREGDLGWRTYRSSVRRFKHRDMVSM
jgi:hypothetical protein